MSKKKIIAGLALGTFALILAGCGNKAAPDQDSSQNQFGAEQAKTEQAIKDNSVQKMPEATGKVDDTVDAIIDGATSEEAQATSTDADAQSAVGDGEGTNNLNSTYDQNAL